ncbi:MAG TPA: DUF1858 domain-containing protein [Ignavibacteriales bacterium]|nr:DUF1858 domain-containing protein [Ignavibacteriales bacterium]
MELQSNITKDTLIEDLVREMPEAVDYLMKSGIRCLRCGEPIWGSLESAAKEKGFSDKDVEKFAFDLNLLSAKK